MNKRKTGPLYQKQVIILKTAATKLLHESRGISYSSKCSQSALLVRLFSFPMQIPCNRILSCL